MLLAESEESYLLHPTSGQFYMHNEKLAYGKKKQGKKVRQNKVLHSCSFILNGKKKISRPDMVDESK